MAIAAFLEDIISSVIVKILVLRNSHHRMPFLIPRKCPILCFFCVFVCVFLSLEVVTTHMWSRHYINFKDIFF